MWTRDVHTPPLLYRMGFKHKEQSFPWKSVGTQDAVSHGAMLLERTIQCGNAPRLRGGSSCLG